MTDPELDALVAEMKRIYRGEIPFGAGTPAEMATAFRRERLFPEVVRRARARFEGVPRCSLLVSLSGFSPETTILAWEILRPPAVLILSSEEAAASIDFIHDHLAAAGMRPRQIRFEAVDPSDVRGIFDAIDKEKRRLSAELSAEVVLDITGGKKLMSAAGALAASQLQIPLAYVDSAYDPELRAPRPGTERLLLLPSPAAIFANEREREAEAQFDSGAYGEALNGFRVLAETVERPANARLHRALAKLYAAWTDLDFDALRHAAAELNGPLAAAGVAASLARRIEEQVTWLTRLAKDRAPNDLSLCFYVLGRHYRARARHDFAALFFYRTLEGLLRERVCALSPSFDAGSPNYSLLAADVSSLTQRYADVLVRSGGAPHEASASLPTQLGFLNSAALLVALRDPAIDANQLGRLRNLARIRNESVLAHGTTMVSPEDAGRLEAAAFDLLAASLPGVAELTARLAPIRLREQR
jgi:CRISPR-associated protein (TIGR02710 family)